MKEKYLPSELTDVCGYYPTNFASKATVFHNDSRPYTEYVYDTTTNNRVIETRSPGVKCTTMAASPPKTPWLKNISHTSATTTPPPPFTS